MADYNSKVRSNYFKVKNAEAFRQFLDDVGLQEITRDEEQLVGFIDVSGNGIPSYRYSDGDDVGEEIDFFAELGKHLEDGWIAEVREIGYEKLRFLFGDAVAVTNKGMLVVSLDDIRDKAQSYFGDDHKMTANIKKRGVKKMSVTTYAELAHHLGHRIVCTEYGNGENIAIECEKCWTVITSFDYQEKETENEYYFLRGHIGHKVACKKLPTGEPVIVCKDCGEVVLHSPK